MSQPMKISYGLNLAKKPGVSKPGATAKRPAVFSGGDDDDSDDGNAGGVFGRKKGGALKEKDDGPVVQAITELGDDFMSGRAPETDRREDEKKLAHRKGHLLPSQPPPSKYKSANAAANGTPSTTTSRFGSDLASALTARKHTEAAEALDPSIYDYDASYDAFKAVTARKATADDNDYEESRRKPQYMTNIRKMAEVRERDRRIAEDKKMQREREAEGNAFDNKETFVTEAYKQQQEENRRLEEAERKREEAEAAKAAETGGMTGFYKQLLDRDEQRQAAIQEAVASAAKNKAKDEKDQEGNAKDGDDGDATVRAREINARGGNVAVNDEGEVVDKRQLLQGGLNISARKRSEIERQKERDARERKGERDRNHDGSSGSRGNKQGYFAGNQQGMRDRQSRMLAAQYEQALKRSRDEEDEQTKAAEEAAKSRKTTADISSAKERYLARKRAEAEAKKAGGGGP
ncbi:hypothetical protein SCUCBS95973_009578 [Sporothrix curviconia]|uniref:Nuclear speckle splicing regulatory protein 1 N-terminal domain-containing protein n=1 Tax=Sporothrix curviconia TaxID=1260050 RepID=A0ABP0CW47_9PEZI